MWDDREQGMTEELGDKGKSYVLQSFASYRYRITEELSLTTGLHSMYFGLNKHYSLEPRAGLKWQFTPTQSLSLGYGKHSKIESLSTYLANTEEQAGPLIQQNKDLDLLKPSLCIRI